MIYHSRMELQEIWLTLKNNNERLKALKVWCSRAEKSGIRALQEFVAHLKSYTLPVVVTA